MAAVPSIQVRRPIWKFLRRTSWHALGTGLIALLVLIAGWMGGAEVVASIIPGFPTTKAITAVGFLLLAVGVLFSLGSSRLQQAVAGLIGIAVMIWMAVLAFTTTGRPEDGFWSLLPSTGTMLGLALGGASLVSLSWAPRYKLIAAFPALIASSVAIYHNIDMLILRRAPPDVGSIFDSMSMVSALLFAWFMMVCVLLHPRLQIAEAMFKHSLRGRILRRTGVLLFALPIVAAAIIAVMSAVFNWTDDMLFASTATLPVILGATIIWLYSAEIERWQAEAAQRSAGLIRANEALERYASSAAHDLKEPARHVMIYGEMLDAALAASDINRARECLDKLRASASKLPTRIDAMLAHAQSGFARVHLENHYLGEIVQSACASMSEEVLNGGLRVSMSENIEIRCDASLMTSVFANLLSNSVKYRKEGTSPKVHVGAEKSGGEWRISVEDDGVGFNPEFAATAFHPLARGLVGDQPGSGIGLATCRTIVESHGGKIWIDESYSGGARIVFTLPEKS